jgi:hypothetical protein
MEEQEMEKLREQKRSERRSAGRTDRRLSPVATERRGFLISAEERRRS